MADKDNIALLEEADAIDSDDISDEHRTIINTEFSADEMLTLIKMQKRIKKNKLSSGAAF